MYNDDTFTSRVLACVYKVCPFVFARLMSSFFVRRRLKTADECIPIIIIIIIIILRTSYVEHAKAAVGFQFFGGGCHNTIYLCIFIFFGRSVLLINNS